MFKSLLIILIATSIINLLRASAVSVESEVILHSCKKNGNIPQVSKYVVESVRVNLQTHPMFANVSEEEVMTKIFTSNLETCISN